MSRYFERADHCARVLDANYNLMLNPSKSSIEQRWPHITTHLGLDPGTAVPDPIAQIAQLMTDPQNRSSIVSCITSARENASQIREQISSEMWEYLNQLYHRITHALGNEDNGSERVSMLGEIREGSYRFYGVTDSTMSHGEAWQFIQLGKYMERACSLPLLLDAMFLRSGNADDLDWVALLASCSAFEAYCKVYTADLRPERVAEFLLLNAEFPYTLRYSAEQMQIALDTIMRVSLVRKTGSVERTIGRLRSSLAYAQIDDIISRDFGRFLTSIIEQCHNLHAAVHEVYIDYPIDSAFEV
jgi:uncharacterized alpha-E superfamily protein